MPFCFFFSWMTSTEAYWLNLCFQEGGQAGANWSPEGPTSLFNKLLEVIVKGKITKWLEDKRIVTHSHHGSKQIESCQS